jgi:hypothetical protein
MALAFIAGGHQIAQQLAHHVFVARFLEIGLDDRLGVRFGFGRIELHPLGRPLAEQPVAPRVDAELHFLVAREAGFLAAFAVVKCGHGTQTWLERSRMVSPQRYAPRAVPASTARNAAPRSAARDHPRPISRDRGTADRAPARCHRPGR